MTKKAVEQKQVDVTIWGVHSHKGKIVTPGSTITVTETQAAFLKAHGVCDKPAEEAK